MKVICKQCLKEFEKYNSQTLKHSNHFCSHSCSAIFNNKGKQKNLPKIKICKHCKKEFYPEQIKRSLLCKDCRTIYKDRQNNLKSMTIREVHEKTKKYPHAKYKNVYVTTYNRQWNKDLVKRPCQKCGYHKHVHLCHIKSVTSYEYDTKVAIINDPTNLLVLCPNCHWEFDHSFLKLENIPARFDALAN